MTKAFYGVCCAILVDCERFEDKIGKLEKINRLKFPLIMDKSEKIQMFVDDAENLIYICEGESPTSKLDEQNAESRKSEFIWTRKQQSDEDKKATQDLLDFLATERIAKALSEKKTHKAKVWEQVAAHLLSCGYKVAEDMKGASIKCHQKWRNLEKSYNSYINHSSDISKGPRKPPPHFDRLHAILEKRNLVPAPAEVLLATGEVLPTEVMVPAELAGEAVTVGEEETLIVDGAGHEENIEVPCSSLGPGKRSSRQKAIELEILRTLRQFKQDEERRFQILYKMLKENIEEKRSLNYAFRQYLSTITNPNKKRKADSDPS